jgi:hypothetical protein
LDFWSQEVLVKAKYINPYTDFGFKKLFGEEVNKELLVDFLNQYTTFPIKEQAEKGAMDSSFEDGEKKGGENKAKEIAAKLKETGIDINIIAKTTGL